MNGSRYIVIGLRGLLLYMEQDGILSETYMVITECCVLFNKNLPFSFFFPPYSQIHL